MLKDSERMQQDLQICQMKAGQASIKEVTVGVKGVNVSLSLGCEEVEVPVRAGTD